MRPRLAPAQFRAAVSLALVLHLGGLAQPATAFVRYWSNPLGGNSNVGTNWSLGFAPGPTDNATFNLNAGFNVTWVSPIDTLPTLTIDNHARPRFYLTTSVLRVAGLSLMDGDSLTLERGTLRTGQFVVGSGRSSALMLTTTTSPFISQLIAQDSTIGSFMGDAGVAHVGVFAGSQIKSNAFLDMAFGPADSCSTSVSGGATLSGFSSLTTLSALGGGYRGDIIVGDSGTAVLQIADGGSAVAAGDLFVAMHGGSSLLHLLSSGTRNPSLVAHGQTYIGTNGEGSGHSHGAGTLLAERGNVTLFGVTHIDDGSLTVRNGAHLTSAGVFVQGTEVSHPAALNLVGVGTIGSLADAVVVGAGLIPESFGTLSYLTVDSAAVCNVTGAGPFNVWPDGEIDLFDGASLTSTSKLSVAGHVLIQGGRLEAPSLQVVDSSGILAGVGTVAARVSLGNFTSLNVNTIPGVGRLTVGDSTAPDGFHSSGATLLQAISGPENDSLVVLNQGVAQLGTVVFGFPWDTNTLGVLTVPSGGRIATAAGIYVLKRGRIYGPIINDGVIYIYDYGTLLLAGGLTQLGGSVSSYYSPLGNGEIQVPAGQTLSARGQFDAVLDLYGALDLGPTPARLVVGNSRHPAGSRTTLVSTSSVRIRLGSLASGIQDTIVDSMGVHLAGALDLRSIQGNLPAVGDTFTVISLVGSNSADTVSGSFATVTMDGAPGAGWVSVLYGRHSVRVAINRSIAGVTPGGGPENGQPLRFASAGTLQRPAFELSLPKASMVKLRVYDVAGREVSTLHDGALGAGAHRFELPSRLSASGVYFARAEVRAGAGTKVLTARAVRLR